MKPRLTLLGLALAAATGLATATAHAQDLIAVDEFAYGATPNLQGANGGSGWSTQWNKLSTIPTGVASEGLTWPGLVTIGGCATTAPFAGTGLTRYSRGVTAYTDPDDTVYLSFLVRRNFSDGTEGGLSFGVAWDDTSMVVGACPSGFYGLKTPPNTLHSDSTEAVVTGQTALMVARVRRNVNATMTWSLFVNPGVGDPEPALPAATLTISGSTLPPAVFLHNDGGFSTDEIRLGRTWASVLPPIDRVGDVNGDGVVNVDDLLEVINAWGSCPAPCPADLDNDGDVDVDDLLLVINDWG